MTRIPLLALLLLAACGGPKDDAHPDDTDTEQPGDSGLAVDSAPTGDSGPDTAPATDTAPANDTAPDTDQGGDSGPIVDTDTNVGPGPGDSGPDVDTSDTANVVYDPDTADTAANDTADTVYDPDTADTAADDTADTVYDPDTADTAVVGWPVDTAADTADTGVNDTADTVYDPDTADTAVEDTAVAVVVDTADTAVVDTDTAVVDTDTAVVDTDTAVDTGLYGVGVALIHEIHADPAPGPNGDANCDGTSSTANDEFVEIVNIGDAPLDLSGAVLADADSDRHVFPSGTIVPVGGAIVVFGGGNPTFDGSGAGGWCGTLPSSVTVTVANGGSKLALNNNADTVTLTSAWGTVLDSYTFGAEGNNDESLTRDPQLSFAAMVGHTQLGAYPQSPGTAADGTPFDELQLDTGYADTAVVEETAWVDTAIVDTAPLDTALIDTARLDTAIVDTAPLDTALVDTAPPLVGPVALIHEVLAKPGPAPDGDANCDGNRSVTDDEFVEIVNVGTEPLDLSYASLSDLYAVRHIFGSGTVVPPGGAIVVFGGGNPTFDGTGEGDWCGPLPANVTVTTANQGSNLALDNLGDTVTLHDADGDVLDTYTFGDESSHDVSITRDPQGTFGAMVKHTDLAPTPQSPGTAADGSPF